MKGARSFEANVGKCMDIVNFFEKVEGVWFSQRTTHFPLGQPSQTGQSTLEINRLNGDEPQVAALFQQFNVDSQQAPVAFALAIQQIPQATTYGAAPAAPQQTTILVGLQSDNAAGRFFSQTEQQPAVEGRYHLEEDILTFTVDTPERQSEERLWFMNPNLRMRTSLLELADGFRMASFCSEVRRLSAPKA